MIVARSDLRGFVVSTTTEDPDANVGSMRRLSSMRTCVAANRWRYKLVLPAPGRPIMMMHSSTLYRVHGARCSVQGAACKVQRARCGVQGAPLHPAPLHLCTFHRAPCTLVLSFALI